MALKMETGRLIQDELVYELGIRGIGTGTVEEMRKSLARSLKMEKGGFGSFTWPDYPYSFEDDAAAVTVKLQEIRGLLNDFTSGKGSNKYKKIETKLAHTMGRLDRATPTDEPSKKVKADLLARVLALMTDFEEKTEANERNSGAGILDISVLSVEGGFEGDEETDQGAAMRRQSTPGLARGKSVPVAKWDIKFTGEKKSLSLNAFLERVDELCVARYVSREELFDSAIDLFAGRALVWYRATRKSVSDWNELVSQLREEFQPHDYDTKLFDEIKRRTQGPEETIGIYLAIMSSLFGRLSTPISEEIKLKILMRNISPFYQTQLGLTEVKSIEELRSLCRRLEVRREAVEAFSLPCKKFNSLEPDLAYVGTEPQTVTTDEAVNVASTKTGTITCFNCGKPGHRAIGCIEPRRKHCYKCKKSGYTVKTCPACKGNSGNGSGRS